MLNTFTSYQLVARDFDRAIDQVEKQPVAARETKYYLENIANVKTIEDFIKDDRLFNYAMKAHGLGEMSYAKAFMRKALEGGISDTESFANSLTDQKYRQFVDTFNFEAYGDSATVFTKAQQGTVDKYLRQTLEEDAGADNEGVRLALYFERKAGDLENVYQILADPALGRVVRTALGLPDSLASADIDRQAALIEKRLDIEDLQDPEKLGEFLQRFTTMWEIDNPTSSQQASIAVLFAQPAEFGVSTSLLLSIQQFRR